MRYLPGECAQFDAQMRAIAELAPEERLAWLEARRREMWELASEETRRRWVRQWLDGPNHVTLAEVQRALERD